jgi:hypothetical protein
MPSTPPEERRASKIQINSKLQYPMTQTGLLFRISVIVIYLLFGICDLEFFIET